MSLSKGHLFLFLVLLYLAREQRVDAKLIQRKFEVSYIKGNPDGVDHNFILGINGAFPGPLIEALVNDTLEVTVVNNIQDVTGDGNGTDVTIHWHGFHQRTTPWEDGPAFITQCPLKKGLSQKYTFVMDKPGSYWYHSHVMSQYTAGLWGIIIVRSAKEVYNYDAELTITLNDWYHNSSLENDAWYLDPNVTGRFPPYPDSVLLNGMGRYPCTFSANRTGRPCDPLKQRRPIFQLAAGKSYRIRVINTSGLTSFEFSIDGHRLETIEVDSLDVKTPVTADFATIGAAERYSFIIRTNPSTPLGKKFIIRARTLGAGRPNNINPFAEQILNTAWGVATGVIQYAGRYENPPVVTRTEVFDYSMRLEDNPFPPLWGGAPLDDRQLLPYDGELAPRIIPKHHRIELNITGTPRLSFNNRPFRLPSSGKPLLARMLQDNPPNFTDIVSEVYTLDFMQGVQVTVHNSGGGAHPLHLHGHHFHVLYKGHANSGIINPTEAQLAAMPLNTMKRDTVLVNPGSTIILRWVTNNPGFWTFHCHIDWHMLTGMVINFAEAPVQAKAQISVSSEARRVCELYDKIII